MVPSGYTSLSGRGRSLLVFVSSQAPASAADIETTLIPRASPRLTKPDAQSRDVLAITESCSQAYRLSSQRS
ncbi:hypothetical protein INR49_032700 [Caranx melampygus]|nr:hypothetical protein INR49_032700 [Caranx melampygus]